MATFIPTVSQRELGSLTNNAWEHKLKPDSNVEIVCERVRWDITMLDDGSTLEIRVVPRGGEPTARIIVVPDATNTLRLEARYLGT